MSLKSWASMMPCGKERSACKKDQKYWYAMEQAPLYDHVSEKALQCTDDQDINSCLQRRFLHDLMVLSLTNALSRLTRGRVTVTVAVREELLFS